LVLIFVSHCPSTIYRLYSRCFQWSTMPDNGKLDLIHVFSRVVDVRLGLWACFLIIYAKSTSAHAYRGILARSHPISSVFELASGFVSDGTSVLRVSSRLTRLSQPQLEEFHTGIEQPSGRAPSTERRRHFGISIIQCRDLCRGRNGQCKSFSPTTTVRK
jgi:hypothetical protein